MFGKLNCGLVKWIFTSLKALLYFKEIFGYLNFSIDSLIVTYKLNICAPNVHFKWKLLKDQSLTGFRVYYTTGRKGNTSSHKWYETQLRIKFSLPKIQFNKLYSTAHISSNRSHFSTSRVLMYWTYKVSKFVYGRTKWMVTIYSKYTTHIGSNGSHFLTDRVLVYWTYQVSKFGYGRTKWLVTMYSKYTANISSNRSQFFTAKVFVY